MSTNKKDNFVGAELQRIDHNGVVYELGYLPREAIDRILRGYSDNGMFYSKSGVKQIYIVKNKRY